MNDDVGEEGGIVFDVFDMVQNGPDLNSLLTFLGLNPDRMKEMK